MIILVVRFYILEVRKVGEGFIWKLVEKGRCYCIVDGDR